MKCSSPGGGRVKILLRFLSRRPWGAVIPNAGERETNFICWGHLCSPLKSDKVSFHDIQYIYSDGIGNISHAIDKMSSSTMILIVCFYWTWIKLKKSYRLIYLFDVFFCLETFSPFGRLSSDVQLVLILTTDSTNELLSINSILISLFDRIFCFWYFLHMFHFSRVQGPVPAWGLKLPCL